MKIYISYPMQYTNNLREVIRELPKAGNEITYWEKGSDYVIDDLMQADIVIFILKDFLWEQSIESMSSGVFRELLYCINNRKPYFIAYKTKTTQTIGIYGAELHTNLTISGIMGTSPNIFDMGKMITECNKVINEVKETKTKKRKY